MAKNILICCDGTGNEYTKNNTNVVHTMEYALINQQQIACYDPGVGTFDFMGKARRNVFGSWLGKAFGYGLENNIIDGYRFLMQHYQAGDRVFIFGFSRGAFVARKLADVLYRCGLLASGCDNLIPYLFKIYYGRDEKIMAGFKSTFGQACAPYFLGLWDTVRSLGYFVGKHFYTSRLNPEVKYAYHAVAIDEFREKFQVSLWDEANSAPGQIIEQVWFCGSHSDVGGSYPERNLSDLSLSWILSHAEEHGLLLRPDWRQSLKPDPHGVLHNSRHGLWKLWLPALRKIPEGAKIHASVIERLANPANNYHPRNLPQKFTVIEPLKLPEPALELTDNLSCS